MRQERDHAAVKNLPILSRQRTIKSHPQEPPGKHEILVITACMGFGKQTKDRKLVPIRASLPNLDPSSRIAS
jgi:hypothetical protein